MNTITTLKKRIDRLLPIPDPILAGLAKETLIKKIDLLAVRVDRADTWSSLSPQEQRAGVTTLVIEIAKITGDTLTAEEIAEKTERIMAAGP